MENIPEEIIQKINSLQQDHKFKVIKYIEREIEVGRTPSIEELSSIIRYLQEGEKKTTLHEIEGITIVKDKPKKSNQVSEKWNCTTCRFQESGICKNKKIGIIRIEGLCVYCMHSLFGSKGSMKIKLYKDGNKKNPPILFLHGFPFDHRMWKSQVDFLKKNYYCLSYDILEKWEKAKHPESNPFEFLVDDLFSILEKEKLTSLTLCGLSMGGYIILRALERKPELFTKIILCDTRTEADSNEAKLKRVAGIKSINENGVQKFLKEFATNTLSELTIKANPKLYKKALKIASARRTTSTKSILLAIQGRTDTTSVLNKISVPTLVICGEYDALTPPESMEKLSSQIPKGEFIKVPDAGHMAPFENPKFVNEKILEFLSK